MAGDAQFESVLLFISGEGPDNSVSIIDQSPAPKPVSVFGNAKIVATPSKYGGGSIALDGDGDYLAITSAAFALGAADFTIEAWGRFTSHRFCAAFSSLRTDVGNGILLGTNNLGKPVFLTGNASGGSTASGPEGANAMPLDTQLHIAGCRIGGVNSLYVDGVSAASPVTVSRSIDSADAVIGRYYANSASNYWHGFVGFIRLSLGGRYTGPFTPPPEPFLPYAGQVFGTVLDDVGAPAERTLRAYRRDTGALVGSAVSNATTGAYTVNCSSTQECSVLCLDDAAGSALGDLVGRATPS